MHVEVLRSDLHRVRTVDADPGPLAGVDAVLLACPAQALRETCARFAAAPFIVSLVKGLEAGSHRRPSEVIAEIAPTARVAALSGPTQALGVARGDPSAMGSNLPRPAVVKR